MRPLGTAVLLAGAVAGTLAAMSTRGAATDAAVHLTYFLLAVVTPGALILRAVAPPRFDVVETLGLGAVVGLCWELVGWAVFTAFGAGRLLVLWPLLTVAMLLAASRTRRRVTGPWAPTSLRSAAGVLGTGVLSVLAFYRASAPQPLPGASAAGFPYYPDVLFHLSFVHEALRAAPLTDPQVSGHLLHYHWFVDAHLAAAVDLTGADPAALILRTWFGPVVLTFVVATAALTRQVTRTWWAGIVGAVTVGLTAGLGPALRAGGGLSLNPMTYLSPSQVFGTVLAIGLGSSVIGVLWQGWGRRGVLLLALTAVASAGAKPTTLPLVLAGLGLAAVVAAVQRRWSDVRQAAALGIGLVALLAVASATVTGSSHVPFRLLGFLRTRPGYSNTGDLVGPGSGTWIVGGLVDPSRRGLLWATVILAACCLSVLVLVPVVAAAAARSGRRRLELWFVAGTAASCIVPLVVIDHPGGSELYFVGAVAPFVPVGLAALLHGSLQRLPRARRRGISAAAAVLGAGVALGVYHNVLTLDGGRSAARTVRLANELLSFGAFGLLLCLGWLVLRSRAGWRGGGATLAVATLLGASVAVGQVRALVRPPAQPTAVALPRLGYTADEIDAAAWLRRHARDDDVVASPTACLRRPEPSCDARGFLVSGIGGTRAFLEGWGYTQESVGASIAGRQYTTNPSPWPDRVRLIDEVSTAPTSATLLALRARHVTLVLTTEATTPVARATLDRLADRVFANATVAVYRIR